MMAMSPENLEHQQQLKSLQALLEDEKTTLEEAQDELTTALVTPKPTDGTRAKLKAWKDAKIDAKEAFKNASDNFDNAKKRLREFQEPETQPFKKFTKLPSRSTVTPFAPSLKTTQRDVDDFFANYEKVMQNHNVPEMEHGKHRFFDCVTIALEKGLKTFGLETDLLEWVNEHQKTQDWPNFKKAFATKFVRDKTYSAAKMRYAQCRQNDRTVAEFFIDFKKSAKRASFTEQPPDNWSTTMSNFADTFMQRINSKLMLKIMNHPRFSTEVSTNLEELAKLAAECEQLLVLEKATLANARNVNARNNRDGRPDAKKKPPFPPRRQKDGNPSGIGKQQRKPWATREKCPRCDRPHAGGRDACTAKWRKDGTPCDDLRRCAKCASPAHTTATCPKALNDGKRSAGNGRTLRVKFAQRSKKRKRDEREAEEPSDSDISNAEEKEQTSH
jgi:hypothetical protein